MSVLNLGTLVGYLEMDDTSFSATLDKALDHVKKFGGKGAKLAGAAGIGIATAVGVSMVAGMNMEPARDKLAAQLGLSEGDSARIGKIAGQVYAGNYGESLEDVNGAVAAVMTSIDGMSTASAGALKTATTNALNFAAAFDGDVDRAVASVGIIMKSGLAKSSTEAFDLITAASQRVPKALREDVLDASDEYSQFFATLGFGGEQAFALLVDAADKGMFGIDKIGDAVKEFTIRATDMSTASKGAYEAIGLDAETMANKILKGGTSAQGATQQVIDGLLAIKNPAAQASAAIALFGTPLEDLNVNDIPAFLTSLRGGSDAMDGFGGSAKRMDKTLSGNASSSLASLKRQAQLAFLTLGNFALPALNRLTSALASEFGPALSTAAGFVGGLGDALMVAIGFIEDHQTIFGIIAGIIMTLLLPALVMWGIQAGIAAALSVAGWVATGTAAVVNSALHFTGATLVSLGWAKMGIQATWGALKMAAAWLIALGPIALVIAAVVGIGFLVFKNWDNIKKWTAAAWNWVWNKIKAVAGAITNIFLKWTLPGILISKWGAIKAGARAVWDWIRSKINGFISWARSVPRKLGAAFSGAFNGLRGAFAGALNWIIGKWNNFSLTIGGGSFLGKKLPSVTLNTPNVAYLAKGGIVDRATLAVLGESGPEAVVPLTGPNARAAGLATTAPSPDVTDTDRRHLRLSPEDIDLLADAIARQPVLVDATVKMTDRDWATGIRKGQKGERRYE